jgi:hypothetical protein
MDYYVHHVPGRLRVRIPAIRQNPFNAARIESLLDLYGVHRVDINQVTGSVVMSYDPDLIGHQQLLQMLHDHNYFDLSRAVTCDAHVQQATGRAAAKMGRAVVGWAVGKALESSGFSLLAAFI